jgi:hypothetical protein
MMRLLFICMSVLALDWAPAPAQESKKPLSPQAVQFFEAKVRPVLAEHCFKCHGDVKKPKGGLRLDSLEGMLTGGDQGSALVPGQPAKSLLIKAIKYEDQELKMPPSKKLTRDQISDLTEWVKLGAPWPGATKAAPTARKGDNSISDKDRAHWSFQRVKRPAVPAVKNTKWIANPIDAFILAALEAKGLEPNPPATRIELVRRVYYDLTGLPPTIAQASAFLADHSPRAYENLVDTLLASPHYGEKWARHWLDLVRYAETNSYERDNPKPNAWRYRDYVIRSFNEDKPYDRFVREQLAGDELAPEDADALIATGFYRLGIWDDEPSDPLQARYDGLDDLVATTGQVFLGLTLDCARCHNHKIDPIPQKDYYRLLAFFQNINPYSGGPGDQRVIPTPDNRRVYEEHLKALEERRKKVEAQISSVEQDFRRAYERTAEDGGGLAGGDIDELHYKFYRDTWNKLPDFSALKHEDAGKLPRNLFDLSPRSRDEAFGFVFEGTLAVAQAGSYTFFLDSDDGSRLSIGGKKVIDYDGMHELGREKTASVTLPAGRLPIKLEYFQNVSRLGLIVAWSGPGFQRRLLSASPRGGIDLTSLLTREGPRLLGKERLAEYRRLKRTLASLKTQNVSADMALCVTETGPNSPATHVLVRGNPHVEGDQVMPGFPQVLSDSVPSLPTPSADAKTSGRRLVLADWLASQDNPLTARVLVNRLWQYHFGRGIVRSSNDFGFQGTRPTHPELLDWLASEFMAPSTGWRWKPLHRLILTSNAYRMSSKANPKALAVDPANDLFWRFDMRRLSAEEIRDSILAVSGNLNLKMFGPSVYPEIPAEVLAGQSVPGRGWGKSSPEEQARRSVYVHVKRSLLYPILESFDLAEADRSTPVRFSTTQPTQALGMLNGDFLNKQAALFAERLRREAGRDTSAQVRQALHLATAREPSDAETRRGVDLIRGLETQNAASAEAALQAFCLLVLNLNEFVYLD